MPKITIDFSDDVPGHVVSVSEPANNQEKQIDQTIRMFKSCMAAAGFQGEIAINREVERLREEREVAVASLMRIKSICAGV